MQLYRNENTEIMYVKIFFECYYFKLHILFDFLGIKQPGKSIVDKLFIKSFWSYEKKNMSRGLSINFGKLNLDLKRKNTGLFN